MTLPTKTNNGLVLPIFGVVLEVYHHGCALKDPHPRAHPWVLQGI